MTYPVKFRQQVLALRQKENLTFKQAAERFGMGIATVMRWAKNPQSVTKRNKPATKINMPLPAQDVAERPDAFLYERAKRFGVTGTGIAHALKRLKISYKKTFRHPKADNSARKTFQARIEEHRKLGNPLVYIDDSGFAQDMPRCRGGSRRGQRCYGRQNGQAKGRINVIGALPDNKLLNIGLFQGNINSDVFHGWLTQELLPRAPANAVFVMDNASFHKRQDIQQAIRNAGFTPEYLPAYSPDLNPIEHKWAQAKSLRRKR